MALLVVSHAQVVATLTKLDGSAKVQSTNALKPKRIKEGTKLHAGDTLFTYNNSKAVIVFEDKSTAVMNEYAKLKLVSATQLAHNGGKIFYKITSRKSAQGLKVQTPFAIIGVKGTQFIVTNTDEAKKVALNEGLVGIDSPDGNKYERIDEDKVKGLLDSPYAQVAEFEAYKEEIYKEFAEYVASFDLSSGKQLVFDGKRVLESSMKDEQQEEFDGFMSDAAFDAIAQDLEESVVPKDAKKPVNRESDAAKKAFDDPMFDQFKHDIDNAF